MVRRLIARGLLTEIRSTPDESLVNPDQVDAVCQREDLADLVAANTIVALSPGPPRLATGSAHAPYRYLYRSRRQEGGRFNSVLIPVLVGTIQERDEEEQ
ncbi:hypothetical protein AB0O75_43595 [Streptomyces sp. NPDC088921]|uniref:hypothetical protein n=1 Tax=unclassified Streptomyces TaxID=2593676 RepID=UPI0034419640